MTDSTPVRSRVSAVTVYLRGAYITRTAVGPVGTEGRELVLGHLPATLDPNSIRVTAGDGIEIRTVEHAVNHLERAGQSEAVARLRSRLDELDAALVQERNVIALGELEEAFFAENRHLGGSRRGLKAADLEAAVTFYGERMAAVREARIDARARIEELEREQADLKAQLGVFDRKHTEPVSEITVTLAGPADGAVTEFAVSYFDRHAEWKPLYDIRVDEVGGDIGLHFKARVAQRTGEDWSDVALTLATSYPGAGEACPELSPWYIDFQPSFTRTRGAPQALAGADGAAGDYLLRAAAPAAAAAMAATVSEAVNSVEYALPGAHVIASGEAGRTVPIGRYDLPAAYRYRCVPRLKPEVFLMAAATGWESINLIAGQASVYFRGAYVGSTTLDPRQAEETLDISLGTDNAVLVTRTRGREFSANTLTGGSVKQSRQWEFTVRSLKPVPIELDLIDQVPVSVNKQVSVDAARPAGAELDKETGLTTWKLTLAPGEAKTVTLKYSVTYPRSGTVVLD